MKKLIEMVLAAAMILCCMAGCASDNEEIIITTTGPGEDATAETEEQTQAHSDVVTKLDTRFLLE